jgi:predicted metal-dependent hydrolase
MRQLILWHAIEELEHKHVAFDVQRTLHPYNYPLRVLGFVLATLVIAVWTYAGLRMLFTHDGRSGQLSRAAFESHRAALQGPKERGFRRALRRLLLQYLRPGFHPNETDERALAARYLAEVRYST